MPKENGSLLPAAIWVAVVILAVAFASGGRGEHSRITADQAPYWRELPENIPSSARLEQGEE
jgi:hypothetical protein